MDLARIRPGEHRCHTRDLSALVDIAGRDYEEVGISGNERVQVGHHIVLPDEATGPTLGVEGASHHLAPVVDAGGKGGTISRQNTEVFDSAVLPKRGNDGWVSRLLTELGHEAIVAHSRNVRLIGESRRKDDRLDAQALARLARIDPKLLSPIQHRSVQAQADLSVIRARYALVRTRTALVCAARGLTKSFGERIRGRNPKGFGSATAEALSPQLQVALAPLLSALETITARIREYDAQIEQLAEESYPEVALLKQVKGVGTLIALTYVLTLEDPRRFRKSRDAGCYVGLQPGRRNSGQSELQLHITREGDSYRTHRPVAEGTVVTAAPRGIQSAPAWTLPF